MKADGFVQAAAALIIAIGGTIVVTSGWEGSDSKPQQPSQGHPARKHDENAGCRVTPCVDVPMACYMHGGAAQAPECPHD